MTREHQRLAVGVVKAATFLFLSVSFFLSTLPLARAEHLDGLVSITTANERTTLNRLTRELISTAEVTITNVSSVDITSPLHAVCDIVGEGVSMPEALGGPGVLPYERYYYDLSGRLGDGVLSPGESVTFGVQFVSRTRFDYQISAYGAENSPPVADAGADQSVFVLDTVTLDGSGSSDADGDPLTFYWSFLETPLGSLAALSDMNALSPSFDVDAFGDYVLELIVNDGLEESAPDTVTITTENSPPVADAGADQTAFVGDTVSLDGSGSSDRDGNPLSFSWLLISAPPGSSAVLSDPEAVNPTFALDAFGDYVLRLIVNDGLEDSAPDTVTITTENSPPVADAGPDQSVFVGDTVQLDGGGSSDVDDDPLTFSWSFLFAPPGSAATLSDTQVVDPTFVVDVFSDYVVQLIVSDGTEASAPDTVTIATLNSKPVANAGPDQAVALGQSVVLDGNDSYDADGNPLTYQWSFVAVPEGSSAAISDSDEALAAFEPDVVGLYVVQLLVNDGTLDSDPDTATVTVTPPLNRAPVAVDDEYALDEDTTLIVGTPGVLGNDEDVNGDPLSTVLVSDVSHGALALEPGGGFSYTPAPDYFGPDAFSYRASDGLDVSDEVAEVRLTVRPVNDRPVADAGEDQTVTVGDAVSLDGSSSSDAEDDSLTYAWALTERPAESIATLSNPDTSTPSFIPDVAGTYTVELVVNDGTEDSLPDSLSVAAEERAPGEPPPDPATVAPELDPSVATTVAASTAFLYSGSNPIQTGVVEGTIEVLRAAVIRGKVMSGDGEPLPGVTITILKHPEYGETLSRTDGMFDLTVNGGSPLTVNYAKAGYLGAQRQVQTPRQDSVWAPDAILTRLDASVTTVAMSAGEIQVARGSEVTDADGTRQATLLVPPETTAELVLPDGTTQPVESLSIRVTEYTVGPNGPQAMPAELPPTSGYTYAVELSADEALSAGATDIRFSQPIVYYVEDFIGFPVGSSVPAGFYDRTKGQWVASENGRVVKILGVTGGLADLDTDGDGDPGSLSDYGNLSITDAERRALAGLHTVGQVLWRVQIDHFTPWDFNWPYGPPAGATAGDGKEPRGGAGQDEASACEDSGFSVIECQNQILGEQIGIVGTPFTLNYRSDRMPGRLTVRTLEIPLLGADVPPDLNSIRLDINVAGQRHFETFFPAPGLTYTFTWDGLDAYGRELQGPQPAQVKIGYRYQPVYYPVYADFESSFGVRNGTGNTVPGREGSFVTLNRGFVRTVGTLDTRGLGLGGWTLNVHHFYDPVTRTLYRGDGGRQTADQSVPFVINTIAGTGERGYSGDDGLAVNAEMFEVSGMAFGPDGSLYIADSLNHVIRRITPDGFISTVAGTGDPGFSGDNLLAAETRLSSPKDIAVAPDNTLYIADTNNYRIRKVDPDGFITTFAGNGSSQRCFDGLPAAEAPLYQPHNVAVGPSGAVYLTTVTMSQICEVGTDNIIRRIADCCGDLGRRDGIPASDAWVWPEGQLAVGSDESLYFSDARAAVRQITPDGLTYALAGTYTLCPSATDACGDGGPASLAQFYGVQAVALDVDGSLYVSDVYRIRRLAPDGTISTVAGTGEPCVQHDPSLPPCGDGGPATAAKLGGVRAIAVAPDGSVYLSEGHRIRVLRRSLLGATDSAYSIPSRAGDELYVFDVEGRHVKTLNTLTGSVRYEFIYEDGVLVEVIDGDNNSTRIRHNGDGDPTAIIGPYNQTTTFSVDTNGYLDRITNPANESYSFGYSDDGLLEWTRNPRNFTSTYFYDSLGRLKRALDPADGSTTLARTELPDGYQVTKTSALGRTTTYRVERLPNGDQLFTNTFPSGAQATLRSRPDGSTVYTNPDGTEVSMREGPDPRFGMQAPFAESASIVMPQVGSRLATTTRTADLADDNDVLSLITLTNTTTVNGKSFVSNFDASTGTISYTTPRGRKKSETIDEKGQLKRSHAPGLFEVIDTYDSRGRWESSEIRGGVETRIVTLVYDSGGQVERIVDALGTPVRYQYDAVGRVLKQTFPDDRVVSFRYDENGNRTAIIPPGREAHLFEHTALDLTSAYIAPDVGEGPNITVYAYDDDGKLSSITRPDNHLVEFGYDGAGRLNKLATPEGDTTYTYNPSTGTLTSVETPAGSQLSYHYKGALVGKVAWSGEIAGSVDFDYDNNFRLRGVRVNETDAISYHYDDDSFLIQAGDLTLNRSFETALLLGTTLGQIGDQYFYNGFGEVINYDVSFDNAPLYEAEFSYDKLGRITEKIETVGAVTNTYEFRYDLGRRLVEVKKNDIVLHTYGYDDNGNRTHSNGIRVAQYDGQDRMLEYDGATYEYTANGELRRAAVGTQTTNYQYDALGNLREIVLPDGTTIEYLVDGYNRRIGKKVNGILVQGFIYESRLRPIAELGNKGQVVARFVYATRDNVPDYMIKDNVTYRIIADHLGSPRLIVDVATNTVVQEMEYDVWGNVLRDSNPGFQPFGFAGGIIDNDTGLVRFGARDYDSSTGRWTSKDVSLSGRSDFNLYGYVGNDPVNFLDVDGLRPDLNYFSNAERRHGQAEADMRAAAQQVPSEAGVFLVVGHGDPYSVEDDKGNYLTAKQFAERLSYEDKFKDANFRAGKCNLTIKLLNCNTGLDAESDGQPFAQQLAEETGCRVEAPLSEWNYAWDTGKGIELTNHGIEINGNRTLKKQVKVFCPSFKSCPPKKPPTGWSYVQ